MESDEKHLEKINKLKDEMDVINAEVQRRMMVANEKIAGWLIEAIQFQRDKLQDKANAYYLIGIMLRLNELRNYVQLEYWQGLQKTESGVLALSIPETHKETLKPMLKLVSYFYETIRTEMVERFKTEDKSVSTFPKIETSFNDSERLLTELYICIGQMSAFVLSKISSMF